MVRKDPPEAARAEAHQNLIHGGKDLGARPADPHGTNRDEHPTHAPDQNATATPTGIPAHLRSEPGPLPTIMSCPADAWWRRPGSNR